MSGVVGLASIIGKTAWGAGKIFDWTGSYTWALWAALVAALTARPSCGWRPSPPHPAAARGHRP
ncbi:MAG: hypothetical protein MZV70_63860 [Desulfobacterales bacterium]|nr:hypothetical protein [Desulfobacterales bacterium]